MRTSRVNGTTSNVYRNHRRLPNAEEALFQSSMHHGLHQHLQDDAKKKKQNKKQQHKLVNQKGRLIIKGILFADENGPSIHNHLLQNAITVNWTTKMKVRNKTYRNSI